MLGLNSPRKYLGDLTFNCIFSVNVVYFLVMDFTNIAHAFPVFPENKQSCKYNCKFKKPLKIEFTFIKVN